MYLAIRYGLCTTLSVVGTASITSARADAQQPVLSGIAALARDLESMEYRPLLVPSRLELGGWVVPGHERLGSALRQETLDAIAPWHEKDAPLALRGDVGVGTLAQLASRLNGKDRHAVGNIGACPGATVRLTHLRSTSITSDARRSSDDPSVLTTIAHKADTSPEAL
jgi:hypothetical protein